MSLPPRPQPPRQTGWTPLAAFDALRRRGVAAWLLESALPGSPLSRFSFVGCDPPRSLRAWGRRVCLEERPAGEGEPHRVELQGDPLEIARAWLPRLPRDLAPGWPWVGGAVGYLGYELAAVLEPGCLRPGGAGELPDLLLLHADRLLAFDHATGEARAFALGTGDREDEARAAARAGIEALLEGLERGCRPGPAPAAGPLGPPVARLDAAGYAKRIDRIQQEIAAGNVYQACLSRSIELSGSLDARALYAVLRRLNPAPFACLLALPELQLVGSSPERFLRVEPDGRCESRPIKGTRARGASPELDRQLRRALASSPKDRAENLMIVDLVRNDFGRVCEVGSVSVPELLAIEDYASVFQLVSTVRGRLREGCDAFDLVRAAFPPGSMTGAPKLAAMRLLEALEDGPRGPYAGAVGYFDARGGADLSVVIRSAVLRHDRVRIQTGGGIVADSDPEEEWRESLDKAAPLLRALALQGDEGR